MQLPFMKKKQQPQVIPGKGFVPIDRVREMAARGFSEPEMIDILRRDGFSADEVDKALTSALRIGVTGEQQPQQPQQQQQWQPIYQRPPEQQQQPFQWPSQQQQQQQPQQQASPSGLPTLQSLEVQQPQEAMPQIPETGLPEGYYSQQYADQDYIDYVVQQRVAEVTERMEDFQKRYVELQRKIEELGDQLRSASTGKSGQASTQMLSKMDTFSESVTDIDNRLSGLEKAFKDTLPALVDSVRALSDIVQRVRKEPPPSEGYSRK